MTTAAVTFAHEPGCDAAPRFAWDPAAAAWRGRCADCEAEELLRDGTGPHLEIPAGTVTQVNRGGVGFEDASTETYQATLAPWNEQPRGRPEAGDHRPLTRGSVLLPRAPEDVVVLDEHGGREVGRLATVRTDETGIHATLALDDRGRELLAQGRSGVSVETNSEGVLSAVALARDGQQTFPSARIVPGQHGFLREQLHVAAADGPRMAALDPFRSKAGTLMGQGLKAPVNPPAEGPPWIPSATAVSVSEADLEAEVARARARFAEWREAINQPSEDEQDRAYLAKLRAQGEAMRRAHAEQRRREAEERRAAKPTHSLRRWLDANGWGA